MQYNEDSKTGLIAVIKENNLRNSYGSVVSGTLSEIKFNKWLFNNYLNNPTNLNKLYSVIMLKKLMKQLISIFGSILNWDTAMGLTKNTLPNYRILVEVSTRAIAWCQ